MTDPVANVTRRLWRDGAGWSRGVRVVAEEVAVAFSYNASTHAVMMASPADLDDLAVGFTLTEGIADGLRDIRSVECVALDDGVELRIWLDARCAERLAARRRAMAGPTGCGLCGVESLEAALRRVGRVDRGAGVSPRDIMDAAAAIAPLQALNARTHAIHAAAFWRRGAGVVALREDVGRHNALDKLAGALARQGIDVRDGIAVLTSRVSVEMVQKAAVIGAPVLVAVSAPTALAIRTAEAAGVTLIGIARDDGFEAFTHTARIGSESAADVA